MTNTSRRLAGTGTSDFCRDGWREIVSRRIDAFPVRSVAVDAGWVDELVSAPLGVALLGLVEREFRSDVPWGNLPEDSEQRAVDRAAIELAGWSFGAVMALAVNATYMQVGPWLSDAAASAASAYRNASRRRPIAEALAEHFGADLSQPINIDGQQWWCSNRHDGDFVNRRRFESFEDVYGAGQFTWAGLWTVTDPPAETHGDLIEAWEMCPGPISRWRLAARDDARVWEIHGPGDWADLVERYPAVARPDEEWWELPGDRQGAVGLQELFAISGQRAARPSIRRHVVPDWAAVAADHDGVHLSWSGFLTAEGCITDLGGGDVAMLRYWSSEHTLWLADVFDNPEPLSAPALDPSDAAHGAVDVRTDTDRRERDHALLIAQLGR